MQMQTVDVPGRKNTYPCLMACEILGQSRRLQYTFLLLIERFGHAHVFYSIHYIPYPVT